MSDTAFLENYKVPDCAASCAFLTVNAYEKKLLTAFPAGQVFSASEASAVLCISEAETLPVLHEAYCRSTLDKAGPDSWRCNDFYTRLSVFCMYEPDVWHQVPADIRSAIGDWAINDFIERNDMASRYDARPDRVLPLKDAIAFLRANPDHIYLTTCDCRPVLENCGHSRETCLTFNHGDNSSYDRGHSRHITLEEAIEVVERCDKEGLIHTQEGDHGMCNCCGDCCCFEYGASKRLGLIGTWPYTDYIADFDPDVCIGCGRCVKRCRMHAFRLSERKISFNPDACVGCGLCTGTCPVHALSLVRR